MSKHVRDIRTLGERLGLTYRGNENRGRHCFLIFTNNQGDTLTYLASRAGGDIDRNVAGDLKRFARGQYHNLKVTTGTPWDSSPTDKTASTNL